MREDAVLQKNGPRLQKPLKWLRTIFCWAVVILTMPAVNLWLVRGEALFEEVFVGCFLAVFWSFLAGVVMWRKVRMGPVLLVQLAVLMVSVKIAESGIPAGLPDHDYNGLLLMNAIMHGGEAAMAVSAAGVMRLTLYRLD